MKLKFFAKYLLASFAFSSFISLTGTSVLAKTRTARFVCEYNSNTGLYETIAVAVGTGEKTPPLITWQIDIAPDWQPKERCAVVSHRLDDAYVQFNYEMRKIMLKPGVHNNLPIICVTQNPQWDCQGDDILVTILPNNSREDRSVTEKLNEAGKALEVLYNRLQNVADVTLPPLRQSNGQKVLNLGVAIERMFYSTTNPSNDIWK
ncbi:MAG: hypothetical protein F6K50_00125 [Moorea sp. SIO3I7]|uniref:COP23 domain-containing protein n=1 Tax=Moorena sp. SIO3I8 TaxID=2607833 RepID=UPI0013BF822E|nr:COP23 domain-containing protein [Moorena sp. SIO3I8]NEN94022.1 hypothetical protein [Moorena sp. SIO3I7]NEO05271.1 hypothetical protein [Moorena sp. SIO3I8]